MSMEALRWAFAQPLMGPKKAVLVALADHADACGLCWPSAARIAFHAGVTTRSVQKVIHDLEALKLITAERSTGRHTSRYALNLGVKATTPPTPKRRSTANGVHGSTLNGAHGSTLNVVHGPTVNVVHGSSVSKTCQPRTTGTSTMNDVHPNPKEPPIKKEPTLRVGADTAPATPPQTAREWMWSKGVAELRAITGLPDRRARPLLGKLLSRAKDDCTIVRRALGGVIDLGTDDPIGWLMKAVEPQSEFRCGWLQIIADEGIGAPVDEMEDAVTRFLRISEGGGRVTH